MTFQINCNRDLPLQKKIVTFAYSRVPIPCAILCAFNILLLTPGEYISSLTVVCNICQIHQVSPGNPVTMGYGLRRWTGYSWKVISLVLFNVGPKLHETWAMTVIYSKGSVSILSVRYYKLNIALIIFHHNVLVKIRPL